MSRSLGDSVFTTRSPIFSVPVVMSSSPATIRSAVDLPHPDGPTSTRNSPSAMSRSRSMHCVEAVVVLLVHLLEHYLGHGFPPVTGWVKLRCHVDHPLTAPAVSPPTM